MTHCVACDKNLTDFEATRKLSNGEGEFSYPDLCNKCFHLSGLDELTGVVVRSDLQHEEDVSTELFDEFETGDYEQEWDVENEE